MSRLTPSQQREYEEEAEYYENTGAAYNRGLKAGEEHVASMQKKPSAMDRIVGAAKGMNQHLKEHAQRINAQGDQGFSGAGRSRAPARESSVQRYARFTNDQQEPPVNQGSALHPGHRIIVVEGSVIASARAPGSAPAERRPRRPQWQQGGIGDEDHGL